MNVISSVNSWHTHSIRRHDHRRSRRPNPRRHKRVDRSLQRQYVQNIPDISSSRPLDLTDHPTDPLFRALTNADASLYTRYMHSTLLAALNDGQVYFATSPSSSGTRFDAADRGSASASKDRLIGVAAWYPPGMAPGLLVAPYVRHLFANDRKWSFNSSVILTRYPYVAMMPMLMQKTPRPKSMTVLRYSSRTSRPSIIHGGLNMFVPLSDEPPPPSSKHTVYIILLNVWPLDTTSLSRRRNHIPPLRSVKTANKRPGISR